MLFLDFGKPYLAAMMKAPESVQCASKLACVIKLPEIIASWANSIQSKACGDGVIHHRARGPTLYKNPLSDSKFVRLLLC